MKTNSEMAKIMMIASGEETLGLGGMELGTDGFYYKQKCITCWWQKNWELRKSKNGNKSPHITHI